LDRTRRPYREGAGQRMRMFRQLGIDGGDIKDSQQRAVGIEDRSAGAAEADVPGAKMLTLMDGDRALLRDAGPDSIRPLDPFGPPAPKPRPPILELAGFGLVAAMLDRDTIGIAEKNDISRLLHDFV